MIHIYQTRFGGSGSPREEQGNCFQACIASLLEIPLEQAFDATLYDDDLWFKEFLTWLKVYGLGCIPVSQGEDSHGAVGYFLRTLYSIGLSNPQDEHVVVAYQEHGKVTIVHDPNPKRDKEGNQIYGKPSGVDFIIMPLDISLWRLK